MPSTDLLARYLQAVGFWLPRKAKMDILAEISEDLHSQIEDRETSLHRPLNDAEIAEILKQRGRPVVVAGTFLPQSQLIGPVLFPIYVFVLKMVAIFYLLPWFLVWLGFRIYNHSFLVNNPKLIDGLGTLWTLFWTLFGAITFIFAILERSSTHSAFIRDWDPLHLPKVKPNKCWQNQRLSDIAGIVFGIVWLGWLLAVPNFSFLVLGPAAFFVKAEPIWRTVYPFVFLLGIAQIAEHVLGLLSKVPGWVRPVFKFATDGFALWIASLLIRAHSYFTAAAQQTQQYASITNLVAYICVRGVAVGLAIALVVQAWRVFQGFQRPSPPAVTHMA